MKLPGFNVAGAVVTRITNTYQTLKQTATDWFTPSQPIQPTAPEGTKPRQFEYIPGYNLNILPRAYEGITFPMLRNLADSCDLVRLAIETRKDAVSVFEWDIGPKKKRGMSLQDQKAAIKAQEANIKKAYALLSYPDGENPWAHWIRPLLEDKFVIDALCIEVRRNLGGEVVSLDPIDGATIVPRIDITGRTPKPPDTAYQQVLYGMPAVDLTTNDIIYFPRNRRTNRVYGLGEVEQIVTTINIAIRRQLYILGYFTDGNMPETILGCPETWTSTQISEFQAYWDTLFEGNQNIKRKGRFVPSSVKPYPVKDPELKAEIEEWLARVIMYAFSLPPTPFCKETNRATAETVAEAAKAEGLGPLKVYIKMLMDKIIQQPQYMNLPDIEFQWIEDDATSPLERAQIDNIYLTAKAITPDEVREGLGKDPLTDQQKEELNPPMPDIFGGPQVDESGKPFEKKVQPVNDSGKNVDDKSKAVDDKTEKIIEEGQVAKAKKKPLSHSRAVQLY